MGRPDFDKRPDSARCCAETPRRPETQTPRHPGTAPTVAEVNLTEHRHRLIAQARATEGVTSLVLFGSATDAGADRRDEWSDLDFNLFAAPEAIDRVRADWPFLPDPQRIVLAAREYADGGVVLYDDGMIYEFGAGLPWTISDPHREVVLDGGDLHLADPPPAPDPANEIRLFLVKLAIGVGRVRRGEILSGSALIRTYAAAALTWVVRLRLRPTGPDDASPFDPLRRLETAYPIVGGQLAAAVDRPAEEAARRLLTLAREHLEPGWADFPSAAADLVTARFGWG